MTMMNLPSGAQEGQLYQRTQDVDQERVKLQQGI